MTNTDSAYFIPLYKYITENNIYVPKIQNQENGWYYIDFLEIQQPNTEFEQNYQNFIKGYTLKNKLLSLDYEWIYYYVYVILYCDFGYFIERKLYDYIIESIIDSNFTKEDKINAIKQIMLKCEKTPDIIYGWMEGSIISLVEMIIELDLEEEFNKIVTEIKYSTLESYRDIIPYLIQKMDNVKNKNKYKKYFDILRDKTTHKVELGKYILCYTYYYYPDQIILHIDYNSNTYECIIIDKDIHILESLSNYFSFLRNSGLLESEFNITQNNNNSIILSLQNETFLMKKI